MKKRQSGFTLIEMMVVIAIIGILAGALYLSFSSIVKSSKKARATETVSNARTALESLYLRENKWPREFIKVLKDSKAESGNYYVMGEKIAKVLYKYGALSVDCRAPNNDRSKSIDEFTLHGKDRYGIVDPWAGDVLERAPKGKNARDLSVSSGGTVKDHLLYFAIDEDDDGFVDLPKEVKTGSRVRARAIVWCAGADGKLGNDGSKEASDNVYSWQSAQVQKGK